MDFVTHSIAWCRGEIFEGRMFGLFGLVVLMVAMAYWKMAATPSARAFAESEKDRTEAFIKWYPVTMWSMSALILAGCLVFLLIPTPNGRAIGLSMAMFGLSVLFLDHFSEVRAEIYHAHILDYLAR